MKHTLVLSLGSNMGDRKKNITHAYILLEERLGKIIKQSDFYNTEAWGVFDEKNTSDFLNTVCVISTEKSAFECLEIINSIEKQLGRVRREDANGYISRTIDIDIIFYDEVHIDTEKLKIPHPLYRKREFVTIPLKEIGYLPMS